MLLINSKFLRLIAMTITILTIGLTSSRAMAQSGESWAILSYQVSFPEGDTKDFTDATSYRGFGLEGRWFVGPDLTAGLAFNWNLFFESSDNPVDIPNGTVSGKQDRVINAFPFYVTTHYYMGPAHMFYAGLGAGLVPMTERLDIGLHTYSNTSWHVGVAPEIGISYEVGYHARAVLALQYNYAFEAEDTKLEYWAMKIGIAY